MENIDTIIVCGQLKVTGGGERVVQAMASHLNSDIVTGLYEPDSTYDFSEQKVIETGSNTIESFINLRKKFNWERYDVAIFSGNKPQFCLWKPLPIPSIRYCHSPVRNFWSLRDQSYRSLSLSGKIKRLCTGPTYRNIDRYLSSNHDKILANSHNIRSQVDRFYGLESRVLYPPISTKDYYYQEDKGYWLSVNRLVPKKRIMLQLDVFEDTNHNLRIVGNIDSNFRQYGKKVTKRINSMDNVQLEGFVGDERLKDLYSRSIGVLYTPQFEDFGIVPVEAMASGKPVISAAEGGPLETIVDGETGWLIHPTKEDLLDVLEADFDTSAMKENCEIHSKKFGLKEFNEELDRVLKEYI